MEHGEIMTILCKTGGCWIQKTKDQEEEIIYFVFTRKGIVYASICYLNDSGSDATRQGKYYLEPIDGEVHIMREDETEPSLKFKVELVEGVSQLSPVTHENSTMVFVSNEEFQKLLK